MRILVDTNILFSSLVFPHSNPAQALLYIADNHEIVLCDRNIAELRDILCLLYTSILKGLDGFRDDYEEHAVRNRCTEEIQKGKQPVPCVALCPANVDIPGYSALVLEGRYNDAVNLIRKDNPFPLSLIHILAANQKIVEFVRYHAEEKSCTPAQFALAWIMAQRPWIVPIPGTTKLSRLEENLAADEIAFTEEELRRINDELDRIQIVGARYNPQPVSYTHLDVYKRQQ